MNQGFYFSIHEGLGQGITSLGPQYIQMINVLDFIRCQGNGNTRYARQIHVIGIGDTSSSCIVIIQARQTYP